MKTLYLIPILLASLLLHHGIGGKAGVGGKAGFGGPVFSLDFTGGVLPGGLTFTRSSNGTYLNVSGVLTTASTNVARFQYVGSTPYLLYEPAATNIALQSNTFTTTWFAQNSSVATSAQFTSPDGTNDGWSVTSGSGFGAMAQVITLTAVPYAVSVWCKRITGTAPIAFQFAGNSVGSFTTSATITRFTGTGTPSAGAQNVSLQVNAASGSTNGFFGAQVELGSVATSYIATTTTAVTRSADQLTMTIPNGIGHITVTFSDSTTQVIAVSPGSYTLTNTLNKYLIQTIVGSA